MLVTVMAPGTTLTFSALPPDPITIIKNKKKNPPQKNIFLYIRKEKLGNK